MSSCYSFSLHLFSASALPEKKQHHFTQMLYHCFASFKQLLLDFFKLVDLQLIFMLLYDQML